MRWNELLVIDTSLIKHFGKSGILYWRLRVDLTWWTEVNIKQNKTCLIELLKKYNLFFDIQEISTNTDDIYSYYSKGWLEKIWIIGEVTYDVYRKIIT